jgi:hypothetical protein
MYTLSVAARASAINGAHRICSGVHIIDVGDCAVKRTDGESSLQL